MCGKEEPMYPSPKGGQNERAFAIDSGCESKSGRLVLCKMESRYDFWL